MIPTPGAVARVVLLALVVVVLQVSGVVELRVLGGNADLVPLLVAAVAFLAGSVPGALCGFLCGLLLDLAIGPQLGSSSLVLTGVGYAVGRFRELRDPSHGLLPVPIGAAATVLWALGTAAVALMLEVQADVSLLVVRTALLTVLLNAAIALPVFALVRRVLRPTLLADPFERRRRPSEAKATGPLGLRGLEI